MDAATVKFGQALPYALQPAASQLAALHASRTCAVPPYACSRCGSVLALRTRVARGMQNTRAVVHTCSVCGEATSTTIGIGNAAAFPPRKRRSHNVPTPLPLPMPVDEVTVTPSRTKSSAQTAALSTQVPSKTITPPPDNRPSQGQSPKRRSLRYKKCCNGTGERKKRTNADEARPAGLSAFLSTL
ncbi:hypothetical protein BJ912DRAFT_1052321 [Pholiota molesta]|nr:hypothetical protein BJ912DRAFT_1052321 [Pholiota molesta]